MIGIIAFFFQIVTALVLAGMSWYRQIASYPLLCRIGRARFARHFESTVTLESLFVPGLMAVEAASAALLLWTRPPWFPRDAAAAGAVLLLLLWIAALFPFRRVRARLRRGLDPRALRRLFCASWALTLLWSFRAILLLLVMLAAGR